MTDRPTDVRDVTAVLESEDYAKTRGRLVRDPIVRALADELAAGVRAGHVTAASLFHDDGSPRFELMQRVNAEYAARGGTSGGHIGAIAEAIVLIWRQPTPSPHLQLVERPDGEWVAVRFESLDAARDWQDEIEQSDSLVTFRGCVPLATTDEALR